MQLRIPIALSLFATLLNLGAAAESEKNAKPKVAQVLRAQTNHSRQPYSEKDIKPLFEKHCYRCHNGEKQKGDLRLDTVKFNFARELELWDKIEEQIFTNEMPPKKPFLSDEQRLKVTDWINAQKENVDWSTHRQAQLSRARTLREDGNRRDSG